MRFGCYHLNYLESDMTTKPPSASPQESNVKEKDVGAKVHGPKLPHENDESRHTRDTDSRRPMKQAFDDIQQGQVDTEARGSGGLDEVNKQPGKRSGDAPHKDESGTPS
jgi:hypothetical protein